MRRPLVLSLAAMLAVFVSVGAGAQRAGENGGPFDMKSGRFMGLMPSVSTQPRDTLAVPFEKVWQALPALYESFGVPVSTADSSDHVFGALRVTQRRPVGGMRLSRILECGTGAMGPNAERYTVQLTMLTAAVPLDATHTIVETRVGGVAAPNGLNSSVTCASLGTVEERVAKDLRKAVGL